MFADLVLVISDKPDVERDAVAAAWQDGGGEVVRLGRFWEPPALDRQRVRVYGADAFCQVLAQKLGVELVSPPDDLLVTLAHAYTRRAIVKGTLADIRFPAFVKSVIPKLVRARVYADADELAGAAGEELLVSEIITLVVEVRCWVLDGEVVTAACYEGQLATPSLDEARALAASVPTVSPCVVDVGLTPDRGWVVVEANAAWGAGLNGCDAQAAARCIARATTPG